MHKLIRQVTETVETACMPSNHSLLAWSSLNSAQSFCFPQPGRYVDTNVMAFASVLLVWRMRNTSFSLSTVWSVSETPVVLAPKLIFRHLHESRGSYQNSPPSSTEEDIEANGRLINFYYFKYQWRYTNYIASDSWNNAPGESIG